MFVRPSILLFIGLPSRACVFAFIGEEEEEEDGIGVALRRPKGLIERRGDDGTGMGIA